MYVKRLIKRILTEYIRENNVQRFLIWSGGDGWRVDYRFWHDKETTAGDIIRYEQENWVMITE